MNAVERNKLEENRDIQIVLFEPKYAVDFKKLNEEWITQYFKMEEADYRSLDHPQEYILNKGGHVLIALLCNKPVGACALLKIDNDTFELAKMAVSPQAKGKGIGFMLGQAAIEKAKGAGAKNSISKVTLY